MSLYWSRLGRYIYNILTVGQRLRRIEERLQQQNKHNFYTHEKLNSIIRKLHLEDLDSGYPFRLTLNRFSLMSQLDTDGLVIQVLKEAGAKTKTFVDIGCGRSGGNSALLAEELGWGGLMVDASKGAIKKIKEKYAHNPNVYSESAYVTPDNINELLGRYGYTSEVDIFSLDIDSYDYWVFMAMNICSPRILLLEYNAAFGPELSVTVPVAATLDGAPKGYHGASLRALANLAEKKGYRLVVCDHGGANAMFLRNDMATHIPAIDVSVAFRMSISRKDPFGQAVRDIDVLDKIRSLGLPLEHV